MVFEDLGSPDAELRTPLRFDTVTNGNYDIKVVKVHIPLHRAFPLFLNYPEFSDSSAFL